MVDVSGARRLPLAASISFSTSRSVRCSRGLNSAFGRRRGGATVRFTVAGDTSLRRVFAMVGTLHDANCPYSSDNTDSLSMFLLSVRSITKAPSRCLKSQPIICALEKLIRAIIASLWLFRFWIRLSTFLHVVEQLADEPERINDVVMLAGRKIQQF